MAVDVLMFLTLKSQSYRCQIFVYKVSYLIPLVQHMAALHIYHFYLMILDQLGLITLNLKSLPGINIQNIKYCHCEDHYVQDFLDEMYSNLR
jgi:hypothetical protein